jgi:hypothetical protein
MSLARGAPPAEKGTLHARSSAGEVTADPEPGRVVRFGRGGWPGTDLSIDDDDLRVSRWHGELTFHDERWWLRNTGQRPLRLPHGRLTQPTPLATGYTPVFVPGSRYREHLIELYVTDKLPTNPPRAWPLSDDERLLMVVLGQRYLRYEPEPRPLPNRQACQQLRYLRPEINWETPGIDHRVAEIAARLTRSGDFPTHPPDALLCNLLKGMVDSVTLVPPDLALLDL